MCGIFAIYHRTGSPIFTFTKAQELSQRQSHRGPDFSGYWQCPKTGNILCHERLAIMDLGCHQPISGAKDNHLVIHNGEIYNHQKLRDSDLVEYGSKFHTHCDSEAIIWMYEELHGKEEFQSLLCNALDGVFAFAIVYENEFMVARDPIGVKTLYYGTDSYGRIFFSSEMKVFEDVVDEVKTFPPGHFFTPEQGFVQYYKPAWMNPETKPMRITSLEPSLEKLKHTLIEATEKRLMSNAPIGVLLSGGLDSSLVSAIACRKMRELGLEVHSFSIGLDPKSPDLIAARKVAEFLQTKHHEFYFTVEEGFSIIEKLIWHLESYDVTTIRASTPMFFLSKRIHELGFKVVLSGEGADEIFGGYLYFHNAPSDEEFHKETIRRVSLLSSADCLRADKSCMANHLEVRVPFLDKKFLEEAMGIDPKWKRPQPNENGKQNVEKWIIRKAFDDKENPFIPSEILWRQKEQFSDGVGYGWIDRLVEFCSQNVSDEEMANAAFKFPHNPPATKEAYFIRKIFESRFPSKSASETVSRWIPMWQNNSDPSGRASNFHEKAKTSEEPTILNKQQKITAVKINAVGENGTYSVDKHIYSSLPVHQHEIRG